MPESLNVQRLRRTRSGALTKAQSILETLEERNVGKDPTPTSQQPPDAPPPRIVAPSVP